MISKANSLFCNQPLSFYRLWLNISLFSSFSHMESHQLVWCTQWTALVKCVTSKNIQQSFMSDFYCAIFLKTLMILLEVCSEDFMIG